MKILIIDDSASQARLISKIVSKIKDAEPIITTDGLEGFAILRIIPDIQMVILDNQLPYINGVDLLYKLRSIPAFVNLPVIISSAQDTVDEFIKAGATDCLIKPYDVKKLKDLINKHTVSWRHHD